MDYSFSPPKCPHRDMQPFFRALNFRFLIISAIVASISWICSFAAKMIGSPTYTYNQRFNLDVYDPFVFLFLVVEVPVRHIITKWSGKYWLNLYEILSLVIEITFGLYYTIGATSPTFRQLDLLYMFLASSYTMVTCLIISLFCLIWDLFRLDGWGILKPFHILGPLPSHRNCSPKDLVFGKSLFRKRYKGDTTPLRTTRGLLAGGFLAGFGLVTLYALAIQPFHNPGSLPLKEFRISPQTLENRGLVLFPSWRVVAQQDTTGNSGVTESAYLVSSAFRAQWLSWPSDPGFRDLEWKNCTSLSEAPFLKLQEFDCPTFFTTLPNFNISSGFPEILITVNFTALAPLTRGYWQAVRIAVGFGSDSPVANSNPIPLVPGVHLSAAISIVFIQSLVNSNFAALGVKKYSDPKPAATVGALFTNPSPPTLEANMSSLRLFPLLNDDINYRIVQDSKEDSVLSGFALLGGLWTFLNGLFSTIFGSTLLLVLFGLKPLSIYGLTHSLRENRNSLAEGEVLSAEEQARIVSLLREHLLDVGDAEEIGALGSKILEVSSRSLDSPQRISLPYRSLRQSEDMNPNTEADMEVGWQVYRERGGIDIR